MGGEYLIISYNFSLATVMCVSLIMSNQIEIQLTWYQTQIHFNKYYHRSAYTKRSHLQVRYTVNSQLTKREKCAHLRSLSD